MEGWSEAMRIVVSLVETDRVSHVPHPSQKTQRMGHRCETEGYSTCCLAL